MKAIICDNISNVLTSDHVINKDTAWIWKRIGDDTLFECDHYSGTYSYRDKIINEGGCGLGYPDLLFDNNLNSEYIKSHSQSFMYQPNFFVPGLLLV